MSPHDATSVLTEHGDCKAYQAAEYNPVWGFNKRKMEDARKTEADKEAAAWRKRGLQILEDAERLIADWRPAKLAPMLFSPTIGAAFSRAALVR